MMEKPKITLAYIDQYLSGKLGKEESHQFEKLMEEDEELQNSVKEVIRAKTSTYLAGRQEWTEEMTKKFEEAEESSTFNYWPILVAAVAAIFLVLAGIWWSPTQKSVAPQELYVEVYEVPQAPEYRGEGLDSLLKEAYLNFNTQAYPEALSSFDKLLALEEIPNREEIRFFQAIALIETGKDIRALATLSQVKGEQYGESARFYRALLFLKRGEAATAKKILGELQDERGTFNMKATRILERLGKD